MAEIIPWSDVQQFQAFAEKGYVYGMLQTFVIVVGHGIVEIMEIKQVEWIQIGDLLINC